MATKYLYIDDDVTAHGIVKAIENDDLKFDPRLPMTWNEQIEILIEKKELNDYDGLLLDLKLEFPKEKEIAVEKSKLVKFTGADLAQAIRTKIKSDPNINDLPIFLCSTDTAFMIYFDRTSFDLFDKRLDKNKDFQNNEIDSKIFIEYSKAYKKLNQFSELKDYIGRNVGREEDLNILMAELKKCKTSHEKMYLLDRYLILESGLLVDELVLAIRLGIDLEKSKDWERFKKEQLQKHQYKGILSDLNSRWWIYDIINELQEKFEINLRILTAEQRVELLLTKIPGYDRLEPIGKMSNQEFTNYWYKCQLSSNPLGIIDGLKIMEIPRYPWIDQKYISKKYLLSEERDREKILSLLGPYEKEIFEELD